MKNNALLGFSLFFILSIIAFSCRKDISDVFDTPVNKISKSFLEEAKIWHEQNATLTQTLVASSKKGVNKSGNSFIRLRPLWNKAKIIKTYLGEELIAVPTYENKITAKIDIKRYFLFPLLDGKVIGGEIVEFISFTDNILEISMLLKNYTNNEISNFDGAILRYDMNYFLGQSVIYSKGKKVKGNSGLRKLLASDPISKDKVNKSLNIAETLESFGTSTNGSGTSSDGSGSQPCNAVYYYFYQLDSEGNIFNETWTFLYYEGDCSNGGGSNTNNPGTSTNYSGNGSGSGGGSYGGNYTPPPLVANPDIMEWYEDTFLIYDPDTNTYLEYQSQNPWNAKAPVIPFSKFVGVRANGVGGQVSCLTLSREQIQQAGYTCSGYLPGTQTFQTYKTSTGVDKVTSAKAVTYLTSALANNIPVVVGVDVRAGYLAANADHSTDHFVVIVGMGKDNIGKFFQFYDSSTNIPMNGASYMNKLYYNEATGKIEGRSQSSYQTDYATHDYIVTQVRKSIKQ